MQQEVLFLCTGNSSRSQMAEAIVNARPAGDWHARSAGTAPADLIHPLAIRVLAEIGIQHDGSPKHVDGFREVPFDIVVTVCDDASEACPMWLGGGRRVHLRFPDPAKVAGTEEQVLTAFRLVRDDILAQVAALLDDLAGAASAEPGLGSRLA